MVFIDPKGDLSMSLIVLGSHILRVLHSKKDFVLVDDVLDCFLKYDVRHTDNHFFSALNFLYIIGAIEHTGYQIKVVKNG